MKKSTMYLSWVWILCFCLITEINASIIEVNTYDDNDSATLCSLRSAILSANTDSAVAGCVAGSSGMDTIKLKGGLYMNLHDDLPRITDSLTIVGQNNRNNTDGGTLIMGVESHYDINANVYIVHHHHLFYFHPLSPTGKTFVLKGVKLTESKLYPGTAAGVCIYAQGGHTVTLDHVTLQCTETFKADGGGLAFVSSASVLGASGVGTLNILWSEISGNNYQSHSYNGGGIYLYDAMNLTIENSTISHNQAKLGGGIYALMPEVTSLVSVVWNITRSVFTGNKVLGPWQGTAEARGGAMYIRLIEPTQSGYFKPTVQVNVSHTDIVSNYAEYSDYLAGAGLYLRGGNSLRVDLHNTRLAGNYAFYSGGPVPFNYDVGNLVVTTSSGYNEIGNGQILSASVWANPPGSPNVNNDYTHAVSGFDYIDKGNCPNEPYDFRGYSSGTGTRSLDDATASDGTGDLCDIGAYEEGAVPVVDYDGDGVLDGNDTFPLDGSETTDTDGDHIGNNADTDDDNDGVLDANDTFPLDANESVDTDSDGIGNNADTDDDNDGVLDVNDAFPLDANESADTDSDGIGNNADTDDDNDGISDAYEIALGFDPLDASSTPADTDGDGTPNALDSDDDNDGISDSDETTLGFNSLDASDGLADTDGDGFSNALEFSIGTNMNSATDKPVWTPILMDEIMIMVPANPN